MALPAVYPSPARDVPKAYGLLDSPYGRRQQQQLAAKKYSAGVISFNWGVDKQVERLLHHNVFLSGGCMCRAGMYVGMPLPSLACWLGAQGGSSATRCTMVYACVPEL